MPSLKATLLLGSALFMPCLASAGPVTYRFDGPTDTICFVTDYDLDPDIPAPDSNGWDAWNRDTVWSSEEGGIIQYDLRYTRNFQVELEGVQGVGWVNLYYSHYDYPNSNMNSFDAQVSFSFEKGDKSQSFQSYGTLLRDYDGVGAIPFGMGRGMRVGQAGVSLERSQEGVVDTTRPWFVLAAITDGIAKCPGKEKAWKFRLQGPKQEPGCEDRPARPFRHGYGHGYRSGPVRWH